MKKLFITIFLILSMAVSSFAGSDKGKDAINVELVRHEVKQQSWGTTERVVKVKVKNTSGKMIRGITFYFVLTDKGKEVDFVRYFFGRMYPGESQYMYQTMDYVAPVDGWLFNAHIYYENGKDGNAVNQ